MINNGMHKTDVLGRISLLATTMIWASSFVVLKSTLDHITPLWVLTVRFTLATVLLMIIGGKRLKKVNKEYIRGGVLMGSCLAMAYAFQTYGLVYTTPGKNAFLTSSYCVLVPFVSWVLFAKKPNKFNIIAGVVCLAGIGCVSLNGDLSVNRGDALTVFSGIFYALHIIVSARSVDGKDPIVLTVIQLAVAAFWCLITAAIFEPVPSNIPSDCIIGILYLSLLCTGVCYLLQVVGQKYTPAPTAAVILTLESVFGTLLSIALGKEHLTLEILIGFVLIFAAVFISETKLEFLKRKKSK